MKSTMKTLSAVTVILLGTASALAQTELASRPIQENERATLFPASRMIELGRSVSASNCADCHGLDGISDTEGKPHLAGQRAVYLFRVLQAYQQGERGDMPTPHLAFMNKQSLLAVGAYYASLEPVRITSAPEAPEQLAAPEQTGAPAQTEKTAAETAGDDPFLGIRKDMKKCTKCHDATGNSSGSGMPSLTAQDPEYFVTSMQAYVDGSRGHKMMKKLVGRLNEETIREMGVFYAVQEPLRSETQGEGDAKVGRRLSEDCAICHGADGNASGKDMPTLAGQDARYFVKAMTAYKDGKRQHEDMFEAAKGLGGEDIKNLATFYAEQEPVRRDIRTPLNSAEWISRCARCHGINGNSTDPRFPMLAGQDEIYLINAMQAYATGERSNSTMRKMAEPLSEMDIERIGSYFASQQPKAVVYIKLPCEDTGVQ